MEPFPYRAGHRREPIPGRSDPTLTTRGRISESSQLETILIRPRHLGRRQIHTDRYETLWIFLIGGPSVASMTVKTIWGTGLLWDCFDSI